MTATTNNWIDTLFLHKACPNAIAWAKTQPDSESAWATCERGDRMLWIAAQLAIDRKLIVLAACKCARLTIHLIEEGEKRPIIAIETAEAWTRGEATLSDVRSAAEAAHAAAYDAKAAYAAYAASYAGACAAEASYAAYAAKAANAAYASYAAGAAARKQTLKTCADLVRETIPFSAIEAALGDPA